MSKPSIPKGTRDFLPQVMVKRNYIFDTIKAVFQTYGYLPIETPTMEKTETLMGKYGEEGDRLIFKVLNSGDFLKNQKDLLSSRVVLGFVFNETFFEKFIIYCKENKDIITKINNDDDITVNNFLEISESLFLNYKDIFKTFIEVKYENLSIYSNYIKNLFKEKESIIFRYSVLFLKLFRNKNLKESNTIIRYHLDQLMNELALSNVFSSKYLASEISEKALRYDLTVPFARFVVQNRNEISLPFKRYQIQPVWRADRPQRGRYREFYQCDVDVVGSDSLLYEVELIQIFDKVLSSLKLDDFTIKINNRKILSGLVEVIGESDKLIPITVAIDKLDKIGEEGVVKELRAKEVSEAAIEKLKPILTISGSNEKLLEAVNSIVSTSEIGAKGIEELKEVLEMVKTLGLNKAKLEFDPSLARGLNYYTGAIFEVKANNVNIGSICGGGRYDDLTSIFGMKDLSGVGVSFGADRIYDVLEELDLFPKELLASTQLMFTNFGKSEAKQSMKWLKELRENDIPAEIYPDNSKMKKQMTYANNKNIPFVALVGENELADNTITVKNMETGDQTSYTINELVDFFNATRF